MSYSTVEDIFPLLSQIPKGKLLEFGVFNGNSLNRLVNGAASAGQPFEQVLGFDSFTGIPAETEGVLHNPEWPVGAFSVLKDYNLNSVSEAIQLVRNKVDRKDIVLFAGFFNETLTPELGKELTDSVSFAHIDVDLYSSTIEVLNFIFEYRILKLGAVVRYDDWIWANYNLKEYEAGNSLAHIQMEQKWRMKWNRLSSNVFQLLSY